MTKTLIATVVAALMALPAAAFAQDDAPRGYAALGYGRVETEQADLGVVTGVAGWKLWPNLGVEAQASVGVEDEAFDVSIGGSSGVIELKHDIAVYAVAFLPIGDHIELFARAGYGSTSIESSEPSVSVWGNGESLNYGAGASVFLDGYNGLRGDWTRRDFQDNGGEADTWSVSFIRRF
jgi:outer membrane immunogenic protein